MHDHDHLQPVYFFLKLSMIRPVGIDVVYTINTLQMHVDPKIELYINFMYES